LADFWFLDDEAVPLKKRKFVVHEIDDDDDDDRHQSDNHHRDQNVNPAEPQQAEIERDAVSEPVPAASPPVHAKEAATTLAAPQLPSATAPTTKPATKFSHGIAEDEFDLDLDDPFPQRPAGAAEAVLPSPPPQGQPRGEQQSDSENDFAL
jgi:hypothetical protein